MSRETKLGIAFIGILLFVFCALLVKKLTRPSNRGLENVVAKAADSTSDSATSARQPQASPPTLVMPKSENSKPPALAGAADRSPATSNGSPWVSSQPVNSSALMAAPIPITDLGDRYAGNATPKTIDPAPLESSASVASPQQYRSGYGSTADSSATASSPIADAPSASHSDPFQSCRTQEATDREPTAAATSRPDWSKIKSGDTIAANSVPAPMVSVSPPRPVDVGSSRQADANSRNSSADQTDPFHRMAPQELQPYAAQVAGGAIPETTRSNPWERPAPTATTTTPPTRYGNSTVASPVAVRNELSGAPTPVAGISRDGDQYAVQPNDSYWTISEKAYGSGAFFKALHEHNRKKYKDADDLHVGQVLSVPDEGVLRRAYPDLCPKPRKVVASAQQRLVSASSRLRGPGHVYTVIEGDTLFEIARHELGKPARWGEIYEINRDVLGDDFDYLRPGTELILPANSGAEKSPRSETAVRQPESIYPR
jgi:nucleoid-associated protein YgaU